MAINLYEQDNSGSLPDISMLRFVCCVLCVVCCVFFQFILDIASLLDVPAGVTQEGGHTGGRSHMIFHPPSFCGACLNFLARRIQPLFLSLVHRVVEFLCTNDLIVLHYSLGIFLFVVV